MTVRRLCLAVSCGLVLGMALVGRTALFRAAASDSAHSDFAVGGEPFPENPQRLAEIEASGLRIDPLKARKARPKPGGWLDLHAEAQQTFAAYRQGSVQRPGGRSTTLYVQPWGEFDEAESRIVEQTAEGLRCFFGVPVTILTPKSLATVPESARPPHPERGDRRLLTSYVLDELEKLRPADGFAMLAITPVDLTRTGRGTWAFGQASLFGGVAVCSLSRQGDPHQDFVLCLRRTLKTTFHEVGHVLGISHCVAYECAMNGSNSREEADFRPTWFCPEDERKVWLACGLDPRVRYRRLAGFASSSGLDEKARFWTASGAALGDRAGRVLVPH